jgi:hypothetical protein
MILVDTSVWIDHFRRGNAKLSNLLNEGVVLIHPFVIGELACGNLRKRDTILNLLAALPQAKAAGHDEVMRLIDEKRLHGRGLGWIDMHLLSSALLTGCALWSLDKPLAEAAKMLGAGF